MAPELNRITREPLHKLLNDLVDARLEGRRADIERIESEICERQARGEVPDDGPPYPCPEK